MTTLARRATTALARVLGESDAQSRDQDFRVLCLALCRMLANNDDRCYLTASYVERTTGASHKSAVATVNRLLALGVVEDITGTAEAESLTARTGLWANARVVRLGAVTDDTQTAVVKEYTQTADVKDYTQMSISYLPMWGDIHAYYSRETLRQAMDRMIPESPVWNRDALGPRSMRLYGLISEAPAPVSARAVSKFLGVRRDRAMRYLRPLSEVGLVVEDVDGRWLPGPVRPEDLSMAPEQSPALPSPLRPSQPQESAMPDLFPCPCGEWRYPGDECPGCGHSERRPASTHSDEPTGSLPSHPSVTCFSLDGAVITERRAVDGFIMLHHPTGRAKRFSHLGQIQGVYAPGTTDYPTFLYEFLT